jgi:hypothetical protein
MTRLLYQIIGHFREERIRSSGASDPVPEAPETTYCGGVVRVGSFGEGEFGLGVVSVELVVLLVELVDPFWFVRSGLDVPGVCGVPL